MKNSTFQSALSILGENCGLLNAGVIRSTIETTEKKYRPTYQRLIVRSKVSENGDISEFSELVDPNSIPHPLSGVIYDPATMSMTAQLAAGVELKEVHIGNMFSDPLEAERLALRANSYLQKVVASNEEKNQPADSSAEPAADPVADPAADSSTSNN